MSLLANKYRKRYSKFLVPVAKILREHLANHLANLPRIDRITARPKSVSRFLDKAAKRENGKPKYANPLNEIQDQIGARVIVFYPSDVPKVSKEVRRYFRFIENHKMVPDAENEFGYVGEHFILLLPADVIARVANYTGAPQVFELQIKTMFQHAWAEAEHDLGYKPPRSLTPLQKRKMAFTAAQAWGADQIFNELFKEVKRKKLAEREGSAFSLPHIHKKRKG